MMCEQIYDAIKVSDIGIATVYRTIYLLTSLGVISKIDFDDGFSRYELNADNNNDHEYQR